MNQIIKQQDDINWIIFCHLGGLLSIYMLNIIIPLAIWLTQKKQSYFIENECREIVNFQLSLVIYEACLLLIGLTVIGIPLAIIGGIALIIINIVSIIRGALKTSKGKEFRYPMNLRLLK